MNIINMITEFLTKASITICAFLLPLYTSFLLIGAIVLIDTLFALLANKKLKIPYTEYKFDNFFYKSITYMLTLLVTHVVSVYFQFDSALIVKTMTSIIVIKELNSCDKSVEILVGFSTFKFLISKLQNFVKK